MPSPADPHKPSARVAALRLVDRLQRAIQRNSRADLVDCVRELAALRAPMGKQWISLAKIAAENGEIGLAREGIGIYAESAGGDPAARFVEVSLLTSIGAWRDAYAVLQELPPDIPDLAVHACTRGTAAFLLGHSDEARDWLGEAVRLRPAWGSAWIWLAGAVDFGQEPELADLLFGGEKHVTESATPQEQGAYYYALGKAHADRAEHARAFAAYARGARLLKSQLSYSREQDAYIAANVVAGFDAEGIAAIARQQEQPTARTIFVMGQPRSGTTLVEHILTSHSAVGHGAEINRLGLLMREIGDLSYPALENYVERTGASAAARLWDHWLDELVPGPGRVVDKTFTTTRLAGVAAALLPEAPLIWLTRDPLDCAWSCFRTHFAGGVPWSYDLEDIAFHFRLEDELLMRWREILGDRLLVVPLEKLASAPDPWIRRIASHCGLSEELQMFAPHENRRAVATASAMQVRRPISRAGIGSAEPYREFLEPFTRAYFG